MAPAKTADAGIMLYGDCVYMYSQENAAGMQQDAQIRRVDGDWADKPMRCIIGQSKKGRAPKVAAGGMRCRSGTSIYGGRSAQRSVRVAPKSGRNAIRLRQSTHATPGTDSRKRCSSLQDIQSGSATCGI